MNVITAPSVFMVGEQIIIESEMNEFLNVHQFPDWTTDTDEDAEKLVEVAGRLCYMSFTKPRPGGNAAYLNHIKESGHGSVMEHAVFNFIISGVSRSFTHELVRHRAGFGYSQLSQRYVDESIAEFVVPAAIKNDPEAFAEWLKSCAASHVSYLKICKRLLTLERCPSCRHATLMIGEKTLKCCCDYVLTREEITAARKNVRQAARSVLPNATETKIFVTANVRALRHFVELRGTKFAEPEIRAVAVLMLEKLVELGHGNFFGDYSITGDLIDTPYKKI